MMHVSQDDLTLRRHWHALWQHTGKWTSFLPELIHPNTSLDEMISVIVSLKKDIQFIIPFTSMKASHSSICAYPSNKKLRPIDQVNGRHYQLTSEAWLQNMDRHEERVRELLRQTYPPGEALPGRGEITWFPGIFREKSGVFHRKLPWSLHH